MNLRPARPEDAEAMLSIYAPIVRDTATSFESEPPSVDEFSKRIQKYGEHWAWLVAERDGELLGYAYGSSHRERAAYRWSTETSVYVAEFARGQGLGRKLYEALLPVLAERGYCNAYAGIAMPNDASLALHRAVGFRDIGVFERVGHKFGRWHNVAWLQKQLRDQPPEA